MKAKILKYFLNITLALLFAVALMLLYRAHMELKYNYESLAWQLNNKTEQLDETIATLFQRTHQDAQKNSK